ncbi:MAG: type-F conjugative transfer system pilin assembly protein TraF [Alphaproteobacteria bacterium]|nr:type-F conjugative transfer system pilin assembly protein TraF [Alphaproteobacteria bacterium]
MLQRAELQYCRIKHVKWKCKILYVTLFSVLPLFCNTAVKTTSQPLIQFPQRPRDSVKPISNNHSQYWVKDYPTAQPSKLAFFERRAEGWHWYENSLSDDKVEEKKKERSSGRSSPSPTPTEKIEVQRKELETKLHTAILEPTQENVIVYIIAQKALMDQSQRFSEAWKQVVLTTPSLDETLVHPVDQNARHVYYTERNKELTSRIKALAQDYGLFFFFRKNCPYCHHFAPIVKHFAEKHSWSVLAISLDGGILPEFPHARKNNGIAERLHISHVPALIALHPQSGQTIPLAYGLVSESEIEERVDLLTRVRTYPLGENP